MQGALSPTALLGLEDAQGVVMGGCPRLPVVTLPLLQALGLVTAGTVTCGEDVPPFDNTAMDGYAVRAEDTVGAPKVLRVLGELAAGVAPGTGVGAGEAMRIMTGAPLPPGADAVVMVERTVASPDGRTVEIEVAVEPGTARRRAGDDLRAGEVAVAAGAVLTPGRVGVLASVGVTEVGVVRRARVGVLSTGDELVEGSAPLRPGQIRDSNRPTLLGLLAESGCEAVDLGVAPDDKAVLTVAVEDGVGACDALVTTGGVSMGDYDLVKVVLDDLGDMRWMQVAIKPAKPLAFGVVRATPVFGLPGNPVSSMVSFELFARPALRQMMGLRRLHRPTVRAVAAEPLSRRPDGKTHFMRVVAGPGPDGGWRARSAGSQGSHQLSAMAAANALAVLPDGEGIEAGGDVMVMLLRSLEDA